MTNVVEGTMTGLVWARAIVIACFVSVAGSQWHCFMAADQVIVVKAGKLIDTEAGAVLSNQAIALKNGKIESIGSASTVPKGARIIDLSDKTVLPGLIDCHTHLTDENNPDPVVELQTTAAQKAFQSIPYAKRTVEAGFTTVRDVGTYRALIDVALRDAIARGDVVGPRMYVAGAYITISGGGGALTGFSPDVEIPWDLKFGRADNPWEVRKRVRELAHRGVDCIKIIATGAVLAHGSNPGS
jgi:imidazolonepropionase-like amidohydrolase